MRTLPEYVKNGVMYQLFLRPFTPEGTFKAAEAMLPHLASLGVDIIYLCPFFTADTDEDVAGWSDRQRGSNLGQPKNPYRIADYFHVDEEYGTDEDLADFVAAAHELGMRVIFDLVYFHCGPTAVFLAEHPDYVMLDADGKIAVGEWRFPRLNYANRELRDYLISNMKELIERFDVDGYRCDVGDGVPLDFWEEAREAIEPLKDGLMMLNEGHKKEALDKAFELNYGYNLRNGILAVAKGEPVSKLSGYLRDIDEYVGGRAIEFLDNHDTANNDWYNRLETQVGGEVMELALVINLTLNGHPMLYNGVEVADTNRHSIWGNRFHGANLTIDWQNLATAAGQKRLQLVKKLTALRREYADELGIGEAVDYLDAANDRVFVMRRSSIVVAANFSDEAQCVNTGVTAEGVDPLLMRGASVSAGGTISMNLAPHGFAVVRAL